MNAVPLIIRMIAVSGLLYGYYYCFLRNRGFHGYNRFYLLAAAAAAAIIPFLSIPLRLPATPEQGDGLVKALRVMVLAPWNESGEGLAGNAGWGHWVTWQNGALLFYIIGLAAALAGFVKSLLYIVRVGRKYPFEQVDSIRLYDTVEPGAPFSFFRLVFWHRAIPFNTGRGQQIFRHELYHVQQRHSSDIVFMELLCCIAWFNPFFHLIKKELKVLHEFLADAHAVAQHNRLDYAELLVTQAIRQKKAGLSHPFAQQPIKRRIIMLTNTNPTHRKSGYFSRAMVLPLLLVLFSAFALRPVHFRSTPLLRAGQPVSVVIDAGHGGIDPGAQVNNFTEKDIALSLAQKVNELSPQYNVRVTMTRNTDELPGGAVDIIDGLRKRVIIADQANADLFISLHVNVSNNTASLPKGFEAYITRSNVNKKDQLLATTLLQQLGSIYTVAPDIKQRMNKGIWVLDHNPRPAVLIECGNMSLPEDLAFITNKDNQEKVARMILESIVKYTQVKE